MLGGSALTKWAWLAIGWFSKIGQRYPLPGRVSPGPPPGARPWGGAQQRAPGGRACAHGARSGTAQKYDVGPPFDGLTTRGRGQGVWVQCELVSSRRLVREAELLWLDILGLFHSGVARCKRRRAGVGILIAPPAVCLYIGFSPGG